MCAGTISRVLETGWLSVCVEHFTVGLYRFQIKPINCLLFPSSHFGINRDERELMASEREIIKKKKKN